MNEKQIVTEAANKYGISPRVLWGLYGTETAFGKNVSRSSAGAVGPFQFLPSTAKGMGVNPYDFKSAAFGAARYLSQYRNRGVGGMLSAYNAGPGGGFQRSYVDTTLRNARSYGGAAGGSAPEAGASPAGGLPSAPTTTTTGPTFDQAGFQKAQKAAILGKLLSASGERKDNPLFASGLASTRMPLRTEFTTEGGPSQRVSAPEAPPAGHLVPGKGVSIYIPPQPGTGAGRHSGPVPNPSEIRVPGVQHSGSELVHALRPALHYKEQLERNIKAGFLDKPSAERIFHAKYPHYAAQERKLKHLLPKGRA